MPSPARDLPTRPTWTLAVLLLVAPVAHATPDVSFNGEAMREVQTRGTWSQQGHLIEGAPGHMDVWLSDGPALRNGTVTATLALGPSPRVTLLLRTHTLDAPAGTLEGLSAVGLTLRRDRLRWERWDGGVTLPLAHAVRTDRLADRTVTVTLTAAGPELQATVREGDTVLATTRVRDTGSGAGTVGIRAQGDTASRLLALDIEGPPTDPARGDPNAPLGPERFVLVPPDATIPKAFADTVLGVWPYDQRGYRGLLLPDAAALDRLAAMGLPHEVRPLVPFWAWDADVRAAAGAVPIGPDGPDLQASYKDPDMVEAVLRHQAEAHPDRASLREIGRSHRDRPIWALRITDRPREHEALEPMVLITGAIHGSELLSTEYALDAAARLLRPDAARWTGALDIWVVPLVNPDGNDVVHRVTRYGGRKNGRDTTANQRVDPWEGVDLNRNFPLGFGRDEQASRSFPNSAYFRGPDPLSEPESRALARIVATHRPTAALSFHTNGSMILVPYTLDGIPQPEPHTAWAIAEHITTALPPQPSGTPLRVRRQLYPVDGTDQDWMRHAHGTLAYIVEGSHHNPTDPATRRASIAALRPLVPALLDRILQGPRIAAVTVDPRGHPVEAVITTDAEILRADETWTSRPWDGLVHRPIVADGPVRITASAEGYAPVTATVDPTGAPIRLVLEPLEAP